MIRSRPRQRRQHRDGRPEAGAGFRVSRRRARTDRGGGMTQQTATPDDLQAVEKLRDAHERIQRELGKVIVGQDEVIEELLIAIFARGHCLLVGVPGLAKTLLVRTLARTLDLSFSAHPVHARPDALRHHRHRGARGGPGDRPARVPVRARARSSPTSSWPTRSTARRPRRRPRCWRRCRSGRSRPAGRPHHAAAAVLRAGDAEPDRAGRHLPAARGAARPLHVQRRRRLPDAGRGGARSSRTTTGADEPQIEPRARRGARSSRCRSSCAACRWPSTSCATR